MFEKMKNKMLISNMLIISIVMLISFITIYVVTYIDIQNENNKSLLRVPIINIDGIKSHQNIGDNNLNSELAKMETSFNIFLDENNSIVEISSYLDMSEEEYQEIILGLEGSKGEVEINGKIWLYQKTRVSNFITNIQGMENSYYEILFMDITESKETLNNLLIILIVTGTCMLIVIYFISRYVANKSIKPVEMIWQKQKQFIADATHELKTPLTIINANVDAVLVDKNKKVKDQEKWMVYVKNEIKGMNKLINELLNTAKSEEEKIKIESINLSETLNELVTSVETIIFEKNIKLVLDIEDDIKISTDIEKIRQVFLILIDNAIKYSEESGYINIKLVNVKKDIIFEIENSGIGISKEDIPYIFDRFYKADKSRTDNSYGLGLFIAKTIIDRLKGKIKVESIENEKTIFRIELKNSR